MGTIDHIDALPALKSPDIRGLSRLSAEIWADKRETRVPSTPSARAARAASRTAESPAHLWSHGRPKV